MSSQEQERLKRLRARQLAERDPLIKQREFQRMGAVKEKRAKKPSSLSKAWGDIPHVVKLPLYGLIFGIALIIILPYLWDSPWTFLVGAGITIVIMIFGVMTGNALDLRDDIKDNLK
jgi:hypothetical protein